MDHDAAEKKPTTGTVTPSLARDGGLSYLEIPAVDPARSASFYEAVFGWTIDRSHTERPKFMDRSSHLLGRWIVGRTASRDPGFGLYFYVDDIRTAVERAATQGGEILKTPRSEGNLLIAIVRDPAGNQIGLWQEAGE